METAFWDVLGRKPSLVFGRECGSATIWMLSVLLQRTIIWLLRLDAFLPFGIIFAFPLLVQLLSSFFPVLKFSYPLLPVRLAESILGRISPSILAVIVPAHFLGCLVAIVVFKTVLPVVPLNVFEPIVYSHHDSSWLVGLVMEIFVVFMYIVTIIVLPAILEVNKLNSRLLSIPTLPLILFCRAPDKTITFNPAAVYALWYVNRNIGGSNIVGFNPLQLEHLVGPIIGAILAGLFCNYAFPDDPTTWIRSSSSKKLA